MAKQVQAQVAGGKIEVYKNVKTLGDLREKLDIGDGYTATMNGEPVEDDDKLDEYSLVCFAPAVRGGN